MSGDTDVLSFDLVLRAHDSVIGAGDDARRSLMTMPP